MFVYHLGLAWPEPAIRWLRCLGGKLGLQIDRDDPYLLLDGTAPSLTPLRPSLTLPTTRFPGAEYRYG
jgi:hypothetical protein